MTIFSTRLRLLAAVGLASSGCAHVKAVPATAAVDAEQARETEDAALRRALLDRLGALLADVVSSDASRPLDPDVAPFLRKAYAFVSERHDELLRKADLEIRFASMEALGQAVSIMDCLKLCANGTAQGCQLVDMALQRYGGGAQDLKAAIEWAAHPELAFRQLAITMFGHADAYAIEELRAVDGSLYAKVALQADGTRNEWLFNVAYEAEHGHWHVVGVAKSDATTRTSPREASSTSSATTSL
jgi:hypothetical protein